MIAAVTYSTDKFESMRKLNVKTAYSKGKADVVFEFTDKDIDSEFKIKNRDILSNKKGAGLWLWKPYSINKALSLIKDGDYLMYSDAGSFYINKIQHLVDALELSKQSIMVFELPLISKQWTKKETFVKMNCNGCGYEERNQILANFILIKKDTQSSLFIKNYLDACCEEATISNLQFDQTIKNPMEFLSHRSDQSILSILSMKYRLTPFRDPSQFGIRPWEYILSKEVIYRPKRYLNSIYPNVFLLTRKHVNYFFYILKDLIKKMLTIFPFYINWEISRRNRISKQY